jgi:hypothetical protein
MTRYQKPIFRVLYPEDIQFEYRPIAESVTAFHVSSHVFQNNSGIELKTATAFSIHSDCECV